jgi:GWxTD domain-containing protein
MHALIPLLVLGGLLPFGGDDDPGPFPVESKGNVQFVMDAARFQGGADPAIEVYLSIRPSSLSPSPDSSGFGRVEIEAELAGADGDAIGGFREDAWIPLEGGAAAEDFLPDRHVVTLRPTAPAGIVEVRVKVTDPGGRKRGILDRVRGVRPSGRANGKFPDDPLGCGFSDLVFAWDLLPYREQPDAAARLRLVPNPQHFVGLQKTVLLFYVEHYGPGEVLHYSILRGSDRAVVDQGSDSLRSAGESVQPWMRGVDVSHLPAGNYRLAVWESAAESCRATGEFQVLWDSASWTQDQKSLLEEAFVLLGPMEYEDVQSMSRGEVESYMRDLWSRHDPDPATGRNELRDVFEERKGHADRFFGTSFRSGKLTDRGRVYVRYGAPDEINKELNPQDNDVLAQVLPKESASDEIDIMRQPGPRDSRDDRAYEIWTYQVRGAPLFPEQMNPVQRTGLKFIFVDELGYGDMRLVYTNLAGVF